MGLQTAPAFIAQNADLTDFEHPVELMRQLNAALFGNSGVVRYGDFAITAGSGALEIDIAAGAVFLLGEETSQQGGYFAWSDDVETITLGSPSLQPRIDSIILRIIDPQYGAISGNSRAEIEVVQGTPAGSPVALNDAYFDSGAGYIPGAWFRLADVRVNTSDGVIPDNQITRNLKYVSVPGATQYCLSTDRPTGVPGRRAYEIDTQSFIWYDGSAWKLEYKAPWLGKTSGGYGPTSGATELDLPGATISGKTLRQNRRYKIRVYIKFNGTAADSSFYVRVRRGGSPTTGTIVHETLWIASTGGADGTCYFEAKYDHTGSSVSETLRLSIARGIGSSNFSTYTGSYLEIQEEELL